MKKEDVVKSAIDLAIEIEIHCGATREEAILIVNNRLKNKQQLM